MNIDVIDSGSPLLKSETTLFLLAGASLNDQLAAITVRNALPPLPGNWLAKDGSQRWLVNADGHGFVLLRIAESFTETAIRLAVRKFVHQEGEHLPGRLRLVLDDDAASSQMQAAAEGALLGTYHLARFRSSAPPAVLARGMVMAVSAARKTAAGEAVWRAGQIAAAQRRVFDLVNAPGNIVTPQHMAASAQEAGEAAGFSVEVLQKKEIEAAGLGGLLAVNSGSALPPTFTIMRYTPESAPAGAPAVGLVGKGVTFDTGGISMKASENMHLMKCDMAGGAAVIGALEAAARLQLPVCLTGIVPATDNKPDAAALMPGDIITMFNGMTVEVEDTDAEGRILLADGLAYLHQHFRPDIMIDLATLTGASVMALGYHAGALFSNSAALSEALVAAGTESGEKVWPLPLWAEYGKQIASDIADMKNYGGRPAGAVTAAKFLERFIDDHPAWAHLDIAGVAYTASDFSKDRSSTAFGVRLLIGYLQQLIASRATS